MSTPFDAKLEHLLVNYFFAIGVDHEIRKAFIKNDILTFNVFVSSCNFGILKSIQGTKAGTGSTIDAFKQARLKLVNDALLYCNFWFTDQEYFFANDPVKWVYLDFEIWKSNGFPLSTAAYNASQAANSTDTTQQTSNVTAPSGTKLENDAFLSWRRSKHDVPS